MRIARFYRDKGCHTPNFAEKACAYSHKAAKFAKVFTFKSFPLYGIPLFHDKEPGNKGMQFTLSLLVHLPLHYHTHHLPISDSLGDLLCTHPHPREREGWGIGLYGSGNNGSASIQWSWSVRDARDRLGHKLRAGVLYYLLEGHTVYTLIRRKVR